VTRVRCLGNAGQTRNRWVTAGTVVATDTPTCKTCAKPMARVRRVWACKPCRHYRFDDGVQALMQAEAREELLLSRTNPIVAFSERPLRAEPGLRAT